MSLKATYVDQKQVLHTTQHLAPAASTALHEAYSIQPQDDSRVYSLQPEAPTRNASPRTQTSYTSHVRMTRPARAEPG